MIKKFFCFLQRLCYHINGLITFLEVTNWPEKIGCIKILKDCSMPKAPNISTLYPKRLWFLQNIVNLQLPTIGWGVLGLSNLWRPLEAVEFSLSVTPIRYVITCILYNIVLLQISQVQFQPSKENSPREAGLNLKMATCPVNHFFYWRSKILQMPLKVIPVTLFKF